MADQRKASATEGDRREVKLIRVYTNAVGEIKCGEMKKAKLIAIILVCLGLVAACVIPFLPDEPSYKGESLSFWLDEINHAGDINKADGAFEAVRAMGTNCLPFLVENMSKEPSPIVQKMLNILQYQQIVSITLASPRRFKSPSTIAFKELGSGAEQAIPQLLSLAHHKKSFWNATWALYFIGTGSISALENICESADRDIRGRAVLLLARLKAGNKNYYSYGWNKSSPNGKMMFGLGDLFRDDDDEALVALLDHTSPWVRLASAEVLEKNRVQLNSYLSVLTKLSESEIPEVRQAAQNAREKANSESEKK